MGGGYNWFNILPVYNYKFCSVRGPQRKRVFEMSPEKGASLNLKNDALVSQKYGREGKNCEIFVDKIHGQKPPGFFFCYVKKMNESSTFIRQ